MSRMRFSWVVGVNISGCILEGNPSFGDGASDSHSTTDVVSSSADVATESGAQTSVVPGDATQDSDSGSTGTDPPSPTTAADTTTVDDSSDGPIQDDGLVVHYDFEDDWSDGVSVDRVLGRPAYCDVLAETCPSVTEGIEGGQAALFTGGASFRIIDDGDFEFDALTLAVWMRLDASTGSVIAKPLGSGFYDAWQLEHFNGEMAFTSSDGETLISLAAAFPLEVWVHLTVVWDGEAKHLYVNGAHQGEQSGTIAYDRHDVLFGIDENDGNATSPFTGALDDVESTPLPWPTTRLSSS
jgi:hypothetical protein